MIRDVSHIHETNMARKKKSPFKNDKAMLHWYEQEGFLIDRMRCGQCGKAQFAVRPPWVDGETMTCMYCQKKSLELVTI